MKGSEVKENIINEVNEMEEIAVSSSNKIFKGLAFGLGAIALVGVGTLVYKKFIKKNSNVSEIEETIEYED